MLTKVDPNLALATWQQLKSEHENPENRIEALMAKFFAPPPPCDVEFNSIMRRVGEAMQEECFE